jgi:hypothetical protein
MIISFWLSHMVAVQVVMAVNEMRGEEAVEVGREELQCGLILRYSFPSRDKGDRPFF